MNRKEETKAEKETKKSVIHEYVSYIDTVLAVTMREFRYLNE